MKSVGIVGLGIMGGSFGKNLLKENFEVIGFDILPKQVESPVSYTHLTLPTIYSV